ncbi:MAG TPA: hypothetical protein VN643_00225 [Pyrinomonadaceae bacterium]|nr:hypothetical protein [Pyrinomonadaceae bacterium]
MKFKQLTILKVPEEIQSASGFAVRIFAAVEGNLSTGIPLLAELGGQPVEGFGVVQSIEPLLSGYLKTPPEVGDELVIKIDEVEIPTGLIVAEPVDA